MNFNTFVAANAEAWSLLARWPLRWLAVVVAFIVAVEALMLVPVIGFVAKTALAAVLGAQVMALFADAAAGKAPAVSALAPAFARPLAAQLALIASALIPFAAGILYLWLQGGTAATAFFFGNVFTDEPPAKALFMQFKFVMYLATMAFTFVTGAVVLKGLAGWRALSVAIAAAIVNWLPVLLLVLIALAFEWATVALTDTLPRAASVVVAVALLLVFVAWASAITYTLSARVFGAHRPADLARAA